VPTNPSPHMDFHWVLGTIEVYITSFMRNFLLYLWWLIIIYFFTSLTVALAWQAVPAFDRQTDGAFQFEL
jgi:hypothetical protein